MQARKNKASYFKKNLKGGSSLFEFVIYMAIGLVLLSMGSLWVQHAYIPLSRSSAKITMLCCIASGLTVLKHDLYGAPSSKVYWKKISAQELIWLVPCSGIDSVAAEPAAVVAIGWRYQDAGSGAQDSTQDGELIRIEGRYDVATQTWMQVTKSIVAQHIEQFSFIVNYAQSIEYIKIEYRVAGISYTQLFALRDRLLIAEGVRE